MSDICLEEQNSPRLQSLFVKPQSAFGTPNTSAYAATDAVGLMDGTGQGEPIYSVPERRGKGFAGAAIDPVRERSVYGIEFSGPWLPSGSAGGTCNLDNLLTNSGFMDTGAASSTTVSGSGSTTTVVDVADASGYTAHVSAVEISGELRFVTAVDTASTPNNVTVFPPLSSAPADTTAVNGVKTYRNSITTHSTQVGCGVHYISGGGKNLTYLSDAVINTLEVNADNEGEVKFSCALLGGSGGMSTQLSLSAGINTSDTAIPINETGGVDVPPVGAVLQVRGGSETGMVVTASETGGNVTVTRGSNPDTGSTNDKLDYYDPGQTIPDNGIPAIGTGLVYAGDQEFCDVGAKVSLNNDFQGIGCRANFKAFCRGAPGAQEAQMEFELPYDRAQFAKIRASYLGGYDKLALIFGDTSGKTLGFYAQKATVKDMGQLDVSGNESLVRTVTFDCLGNTNTERPLVIAAQ